MKTNLKTLKDYAEEIQDLVLSQILDELEAELKLILKTKPWTLRNWIAEEVLGEKWREQARHPNGKFGKIWKEALE